MKQAIHWVDGRFVSAAFPVDDRALAYGDGLFETILVVRGRPIWLMAHMDRFRKSARELGFPSVDTLMKRGARGARDLIHSARPERAALRITWTRGPGLGGFAPPDKSHPRVMARLAPIPGPPKSMTAIFLDDLHGGTMARHKSCSAILHVEAARRAREAGVEEALIADGEGGIAEASAANLFAVIDGTLVTPPARLPLLPGVTRAWTIKLGKAVQRPITPKDLARASEAFLTNSIRGVVALTAVDGKKIRNGPVTRQLAAAFLAATTRSARA